MLGDERFKQKLLLEWTISYLYKQTGASTSAISNVTAVPLGTVKRSINTVKNNLDNYLRLLPQLGTREELLKHQEEIASISEENKKRNKWSNNALNLDDYQNEIKYIKELYQSYEHNISPGREFQIITLLNQGLTYREVGKQTGFSVSTIHSHNKGKSK